MSQDPLTPFQRAIMWYAIEGTYLFELRSPPDDLPAPSEDDYRSSVADALKALGEVGLLEVYGAMWRGHGARVTDNFAPGQIIARLQNAGAWQDDDPPLVFFIATNAGQELMREGR